MAPDAAAGKRVKCRKCEAVIAVPVPAVAEEESDFEFVEPTSLEPPRSKPAIVVEADDEDEGAPRKPVRILKPVADEEEDGTPRKRTKKAILADDEEDVEDEAQKKRKGTKKDATKNLNPIIFVLGGVGALLAVGFIGAMVWYVGSRDKKTIAAVTKPTIADGPRAPYRPEVVGPFPIGWTKYDMPGYTTYFKNSLGNPKLDFKTSGMTATQGYTVGDHSGSKNGFVVVTTEYTATDFKNLKDNSALALDIGVQEMTKDGSLVSQKTIRVEGSPGREISMKRKDGSETIFRFALVYKRLYIYGVIEPNISESSETYRDFFDNFKLKP